MVTHLLSWDYLLAYMRSPWALVVFGFQLWMLVDAIRQREWLWAFFIFVGWGLSAFFYYFRSIAPRPRRRAASNCRGPWIAAASSSCRPKSITSTKPTITPSSATSTSSKANSAKAEACYRAALERDPQDIDTRAHFGQCLLRQKRPAEARPLLEGVVAENPSTTTATPRWPWRRPSWRWAKRDAALGIWQQVTENHSYPRAKVQLAELYLARNQPDLPAPR